MRKANNLPTPHFTRSKLFSSLVEHAQIFHIKIICLIDSGAKWIFSLVIRLLFLYLGGTKKKKKIWTWMRATYNKIKCSTKLFWNQHLKWCILSIMFRLVYESSEMCPLHAFAHISSFILYRSRCILDFNIFASCSSLYIKRTVQIYACRKCLARKSRSNSNLMKFVIFLQNSTERCQVIPWKKSITGNLDKVEF